MNNVIKRIEIDLYSPTSYEIIKAQQGDNNSRIIEFILYNQGSPYTIPDNVSIKIEGHRGDNSSFIKDCTIADNIITVVLDSDILYEAGTVEAKIVMCDLSNNNILSTIPFKIHVQKNPCDKNKIEKEKSSLIDWLILNFEKIKNNLLNHIEDNSNPHEVTKAQVGLENVNNTSDTDKPVSTAQQAAIDKKANIESPTLTGIPKAPTASADNDSIQIATTAFTQTAVSNHNTSTSTHSDIRNLILELSKRLNTLADSDDTTLDQLSEIVSYIKSNRSLIENVTTNKVNVSDIIDNITSTITNKPLSANQGKVLNDLITALTAIVGNKVDKVDGKGLSTNDFTTEEKNMLANISSGSVIGVKGNAETEYRKGNVNIAPADIGLGNVGNYKAVSTIASQGLNVIEKTNARENIGAGVPVAVKGNAETSYRTGNVNLTPANIGLLAGSQLTLNGGTFNLKNTCTLITDWDDAVTNGWYYGSNATLNSPITGRWYYGLVISQTTGHLRQIVYEYGITDNVISSNRYERINSFGSWGYWVEMDYSRQLLDGNGNSISSSRYTDGYLYDINLLNGSIHYYARYDSSDPYSIAFYPSPTSNNRRAFLGHSTLPWNSLYTITSPIITSDRNKKHDIHYLSETELGDKFERLFHKLKPAVFKLNEGTSSRQHMGGISQDVEEAMLELGIASEEFAGFCKDKRYVYTEYDESGMGIESTKTEELDENGESTYNYFLRYEEFIFLCIHMVQKLWDKNSTLEKRVDVLEKENAEIKEKIETIESTLKVIQNNLNL